MLNQKILKVEPQNGKYVLGTRNKGACEWVGALRKYYLTVIFFLGFPNGVQVYILDTDYEGFSIHYMCFDADNVIHFRKL